MKHFKYLGGTLIVVSLLLSIASCGKRKAETFYNNCDKDGMWTGNSSLKDRPDAHSGGMVSVIDSTTEYSLTLNKQLNELVNGLPKEINVSAWVRYTNMNAKASLVLSIEKDGKVGIYEVVDISKTIKEPNRWYLISKKVKVKSNISTDNLMKVYVWNNSKEEIWVDDIKVDVK